MKGLTQESNDTPVRFMRTQHQSLFTLWGRVKSFSQALGCRVIDFPDPESQKGFVYLQSLSLFLHPLPLPPLILIPDYFSLFSRFYYSLFQQLSDPIRLLSGLLSVSLAFQAILCQPAQFSRLFPRGVEPSRVWIRCSSEIRSYS